MIKITITSGEWRGRVRYFLGTRVVKKLPSRRSPGELGEEVNPTDLFAGFLRHGDRWAVDYSEATDDEILPWFRAEMVAWVLRVLTAGLPVRFLDREFRVGKGDKVQEVAQELEDYIVSSGRLITIISDDENGLVIGAVGWEQ